MAHKNRSIAAVAALAISVTLIAWLWWRTNTPSAQSAAAPPAPTEAALPEVQPEPVLPAQAALPVTDQRASAPLPTESRAPEPVEPRLLVRVIDQDGNGVEGAWVRWESGNSTGELVTDANGLSSVVRSELPEPYARVRAGAEGYYAAEEDVDLADLPSSEALEIQVPVATRIEGFVLDAETQLPVAGAAVGFHPPLRHGLDPVQWTRSDALGRFSFDGVPSRTKVGFEASTPEYAPTVLLTFAEKSPVEMFLERGERIELRVIDIETGLPIAGACLEDSPPDQCSTSDGMLRASRLYDTGEPSIRLEVSAQGYCTVQLPYKPGSSVPLDVPLLRSTSVVGRVLDSTGRPIEGASIWIYSFISNTSVQVRLLRQKGASQIEFLENIPDDWSIGPEGLGRSRSDTEGRFRIDGLRPVACESSAKVEAEGFVATSQLMGSLGPPGGSIEVTVVLAPGGAISGLLRLNGDPVPGRISWVVSEQSGSAEADEEGRFTLSGVPEGHVVLRGLPQEYTTRSLFPDSVEFDYVHKAELAPVVIDLSLELGSISGRVLDPTGTGIQDASVWARAAPGRLMDIFRSSTNEEGWFQLGVPVDHGAFTVTAMAAHESQTLKDVQPGSDGVVFHLGSTGRLRVRARAARTNETLSGVDVAWRRSGEDEYSSAYAFLTHHDEEGFVVLDLPAASLDLILVDTNHRHAPLFLPPVLVPGDDELVIDERMEKAIAVEFSLQGDPLSDEAALFLFEDDLAEDLAEIDLIHEASGYLRWLPNHNGRRLTFDTSGQATVRGIGPGRFRILRQGTTQRVEPEWIDVVAGDAAPVVLRVSEQ